MTIGRQTARVLAALEAFIERHGYPPTLRQVADRLGIASTNGVRYHLGVLERAGYIRRHAKVSRGIQVLRRARGDVAERKPRAAAAALFDAVADGYGLARTPQQKLGVGGGRRQ